MVKFVSLIKWLKKNGMSGIQVVAAGANLLFEELEYLQRNSMLSQKT